MIQRPSSPPPPEGCEAGIWIGPYLLRPADVAAWFAKLDEARDDMNGDNVEVAA